MESQTIEDILKNLSPLQKTYVQLKYKEITRADGDVFVNAVKRLNLNSTEAPLHFLEDGVVTEEDGELFYKTIEKCITSPYQFCYGLMGRTWIKNEKVKKFVLDTVEKVIEVPYYAYLLLSSETIQFDDELNKYFDKAVAKASENKDYAFELLIDEKVERDNKEAFDAAVKCAIVSSRYKKQLLEEEIITEEDIDRLKT